MGFSPLSRGGTRAPVSGAWGLSLRSSISAPGARWPLRAMGYTGRGCWFLVPCVFPVLPMGHSGSPESSMLERPHVDDSVDGPLGLMFLSAVVTEVPDRLRPAASRPGHLPAIQQTE